MNTPKKELSKERAELFKNIILIILVLSCALAAAAIKRYISPESSSEGAYPMWNTAEITEDVQPVGTKRFLEYIKADMSVVSFGGNRSLYRENLYRFDGLNTALSEVLSEVLIKSEITEDYACDDWEIMSALSQDSVYVKLPCQIKMNLLASMQHITVNERIKSDTPFDELVLLSEGEPRAVSLYLRSAVYGTAQKYKTNLSSAELDKILSGYCGSDGKNCVYGFELSAEPSVYGISDTASGAADGLDISAVLPLSETSTPKVTLSVPAVLSESLYETASSPEIGRLAGLFGINPDSARVFCDSAGVKHFEDTNSAVHIYPDGKVEVYPAAETADIPYMTDLPEANALYNVCGVIARLCKALDINLYGGGASLKLTDIETDGDSVRIAFDYRFSGMPVLFSDGERAAEAEVRGGRLTMLKIYLKNFSLSSETAVNENAVSAIVRLAKENPDIKTGNISLCYDNVSDGTPAHTVWKEK